jgi:hypothetical protein
MGKDMQSFYYSKWFPRLFFKKFDGGPESGVTGYMLLEWKILCSIGLLHFKEGSREAFHNHAFNAITWWLFGKVTEEQTSGALKDYGPSLVPKITKRACFHKVIAHRDTWAITFRGPWADTWKELRKQKEVTLTHGRKIVSELI